MRIAKAISIIGPLAMSVVLVYRFTNGNFTDEGAWLLAQREQPELWEIIGGLNLK
jgi:hypothetical protein